MPTIDEYGFGRIVIDGEEHTRDVIVLPDRVVPNWWRKEGHELVLEDLSDVLEDLPERVVVGTGAYGRMRPDQDVVDHLEELGIQVEVLSTEDAVRRFQELNPAATAAALHLTC